MKKTSRFSFILCCLLVAGFSRPLSAQEGDSLIFSHPLLTPLPLPVPEAMQVHDWLPSPISGKESGKYMPAPTAAPVFRLHSAPVIPYSINPSPRFSGDYRTGGSLMDFTHGTLYGAGGQSTLPGIGRFNETALGYAHRFNDRWMLQVGMNATKVNMSHITGQTFNASGMLMYRPAERLTLKAFGNYAIGNTYGISTHRYGFTAQWDATDRFGVEAGVQRYYDGMRGGWQTVPVVIPYYKFDKFKLGLDVGGILYEVLRTVVFDKRDNGPTIMPPRSGIGPMRR